MNAKAIAKAFTSACLFVGAMLGAGFATGREIALYFGNSHLLSAVYSSFAAALFTALFMKVGKTHNMPFERISNTVVLICTVMIAVAMAAGLGELIGRIWGIVIAIICVVCARASLVKLGIANVLIVGSMLLLFVLCIAKKGVSLPVGRVNVVAPVMYAAMNILLAIELAKRMGRQATDKEIFAVSLFVFVILSILLILAVLNINGYEDSAMPTLASAAANGLQRVVKVIILLAIVSTLIPSCKLLISSIDGKSNARQTLLTGLLVAVSVNVPFEKFVNVTYPIIGLVGIAEIATVAIAMIVRRLKGNLSEVARRPECPHIHRAE